MQQLQRTGTVSFHDASLHIWEDGLGGTHEEREAWEKAFKRDVFKRIVQKMRRLGWTVQAQTHIFTSNDNRFCFKGDLKCDLHLAGRHIKLEFFQSLNCPERPDHEGRYESNKEKLMPYLVRLEMLRTRNAVQKYLCAVMAGYTIDRKYGDPRGRLRDENREALEKIADCYDWSSMGSGFSSLITRAGSRAGLPIII